MATREQLLNRLSEIAAALQASEKAVALLGVGSSGLETERLDEFSDLDFLAISKAGCKDELVSNLGWLEAVHPIAYSFQNTVDGHKVLFADGIFAEFGILEMAELVNIPYPPTRIVWKTDEFDDALAAGNKLPPSEGKRALDWLLGEILTNLYIGLGRYRRGEKLAALRLVQVHAINRVIELVPYIEPAASLQHDVFAPERRFETRFPKIADSLPAFMQGYDHTPESAQVILNFLQQHFELNDAIREVILQLLD